MFMFEEFEEDFVVLFEIKEDIRDECVKLGQVINVVLYDQEKDGLVFVKFVDVELVQVCIKFMYGCSFDG